MLEPVPRGASSPLSPLNKTTTDVLHWSCSAQEVRDLTGGVGPVVAGSQGAAYDCEVLTVPTGPCLQPEVSVLTESPMAVCVGSFYWSHQWTRGALFVIFVVSANTQRPYHTVGGGFSEFK